MKIKISELHAYQDNPRIIDTHKYEALKKSLKDFPDMMEVRPVIIDENNTILAGNMRYKAWVELGNTDIEVKQVKGWTQERKDELIIEDNISFGEWDEQVIQDKFPMFNDWFGKTTVDYSILDYEDLEDEIDTYESNVKKAIHIKVDLSSDDAIRYNKHFRERKVYLGGILLEELRNVKSEYEKS